MLKRNTLASCMIILCIFNFRPFNDVLQKWYSLIQNSSRLFKRAVPFVRFYPERAKYAIHHIRSWLFTVSEKDGCIACSFLVCANVVFFYRPFSLALFSRFIIA